MARPNSQPKARTSAPHKVRQLSIEQSEAYSGPMPHPDHLERYEALHPGAAAMIFGEFESQSRHRREMERRIIVGNQRRASIGQILAFVIALAFLGVSAWLIAAGHGIEGAVLGTVDLTALVTVFIVGRSAPEE